MSETNDPVLALDDIQGDILQGLQKNSEAFVFFKILDAGEFKEVIKAHVIGKITTALLVREREQINERRRKHKERAIDKWLGLNVSFTKDGLNQLLGATRPLNQSFDNGAAHDSTIKQLNDPPRTTWLKEFRSLDGIDGVFLITGPSRDFVEDHTRDLLKVLGSCVAVVYSETGNVRPDAEKGHEHFGFRDGVSQPGIRRFDTTVESDDRTRSRTSGPRPDLARPVCVWLFRPGSK